jgi:hypothetical protein
VCAGCLSAPARRTFEGGSGLTVRRKVLVILAAAAAAMLGSLYAAADYVILSPFIRLEH